MSDTSKHAMTIPMVTSSFPDRVTADRAFADLHSRGYGDNDIHVIMSDDTRKRHFGDDVVIEKSNKALARVVGHDDVDVVVTIST